MKSYTERLKTETSFPAITVISYRENGDCPIAAKIGEQYRSLPDVLMGDVGNILDINVNGRKERFRKLIHQYMHGFDQNTNQDSVPMKTLVAPLSQISFMFKPAMMGDSHVTALFNHFMILVFNDLVPSVKNIKDLMETYPIAHFLFVGEKQVTYAKLHSKAFDREIGYNNPRVHFCVESDQKRILPGVNLLYRIVQNKRQRLKDQLSPNSFSLNSF